MTFTLINARPSPFGRRVAIALIEKGLPYDVRYDVPWAEGTCTPEFSPVRQLPILIAEDGETIYDSPFILEWLETRYPSPSLMPADPEARLEARKRQMLGERAMEFAQALIFEMHRPDPSGPWVERQTLKVEGALAELDRLHSERDGTAPLDCGDIAVGTTLAILEFVVPAGLSPDIAALRWRDRHPNLARFSDAVERRPSFAATIPKPMQVDLQATIAR